ncbi:hypothetical protein E1091_10585 [Micromonospora fluostatini]|uniref:Uncharacterized protein n=1 Tax=Micromonospora fluostatini TaxID=1629071 RepID=A0ABY2DGM1_9ACTN|nr:hypothetical protein E1091_10585 [Micromonospora fluostatini]
MNREQFLRKVAARYPDGEVLATATVLWEGWELDNYVAAVRQRGQVRLVTTDHGSVVETEAHLVRDAVRRHEQATASCRELLEQLS